MSANTVHVFRDDALGDHDAVALAELIRRGELGVAEVTEAARARASEAEPLLRATAFLAREPRHSAEREGPLFGVPSFVKDNTDVTGMPTNHGTAAFLARPATRTAPFAQHYLGTGLTVLGKSRLPEFGFNASTEFADAEPTRNPWHTAYSAGASSGGAAALVAAGAVPIAHANDGGGSIRIPAACCGLVGLKPTRGRHVDGEQARAMPINLVSEGVVSRSVRDTAVFLSALERQWRNPRLAPIGLVEGPARRRLRVGLVLDSVAARTCPQTRAAVTETATLLEKLGHQVEPVPLPIGEGFARDFTVYWGMLSFLVSSFGKQVLHREFDSSRLDGLTLGLRRLYQRSAARTPAVLYRLARVRHAYAEMFRHHEVVLSPVLAHVTPPLGHLSPNVEFDELLDRLHSYVAFTPLNNVAGGPAVTVPTGVSEEGLPIGVHLSASHGDERTLLELAYAIEAERPWRRIQD